MIKISEIREPNSCLNRAAMSEHIFVLRGHDIATPYTIREWAKERIRLGKNKADDYQITEALSEANRIEFEQKNNRT